MNTNSSAPTTRSKWLWPVIAAVVLLGWTVYCELQGIRSAPHLRAVPAFFLGVLVLLMLNFLVRLCVGASRNGWGWLVSREAWRLCAWTVVFTVSTVVLFYNVELWRGKRAWTAVVREAKARGEPLDYEAVVPPQPPDEQNFARAPLFEPFFQTPRRARWDSTANPSSPQLAEIERFAERYPPPAARFAPWVEGRETQFQGFWIYLFQTNQANSTPSNAETTHLTNEAATAAAILKELEQLGPILNELHQFNDRPKCWFPLYEPPLGWLAGQQDDPMNGLLRLLRLRASAELALNQADAAFADLQFTLRLADYGRQRPQHSSVAYVHHHRAVVDALQPLWEGLKKRRWTAAQIAEIQRQLEGLNLLGDYPDAVRADALTIASLIECLFPASGSGRSTRVFENPSDERTLRWLRLIFPAGWSLQNQAALHRFHLETTSRYLDVTSRRIMREWHGGNHPQGLFSSSDLFFYFKLAPKVREMFDQASESFPFAQTAVDLAALACALERYRLANDEFPVTLDALVPQFAAKPPHDIVTGEPLKYRRTDGGGFVLYSVGLDGVDDGGKPCVRKVARDGQWETRITPGQNDWVWTFPGTVASK